MLLVNIRRIFRQGFINFWRSGTVSLSSVVALTITLFVIGGIVLSRAFLLASLEEVKQRVDVSVAFEKAVEEEKVKEVKVALEQLPEVETVTYSSPAAEEADFRERNKDNAILLESLVETGNPFGARLNISAIDPTHYESIVKFLQSQDEAAAANTGKKIIYDISFKREIIDKLNYLIEAAGRLGMALIIVLVSTSVLVTFTTISLAIYISREEISVMRLVGAENAYIRGPFMVEGMIAGVFSAVLALALLYPAAVWVRRVTASIYTGVDLLSYLTSHFGQILLLLVGTGLVLGAAASFWAVRRHLKI
ncbi:MAG: permease-like cell division protein FtsX [Patescibacteria group bacterium]